MMADITREELNIRDAFYNRATMNISKGCVATFVITKKSFNEYAEDTSKLIQSEIIKVRLKDEQAHNEALVRQAKRFSGELAKAQEQLLDEFELQTDTFYKHITGLNSNYESVRAIPKSTIEAKRKEIKATNA